MSRTLAATRTLVPQPRKFIRDYGSALRLNDGTQLCSWGNILASSDAVPLTAAFILTPLKTGSSNFDVQFGFGGITRWYFIYNGASRRIGFNIKISTVEKAAGSTTLSLELHKPHLVIGMYDPAGGANNLVCEVYDATTGVLISTKTSTQVGNIDASVKSLLAGLDSDHSATTCKSIIDEVNVWGRILTSTERQLMALGIFPTDLTSLQLYTKFNENTGTSAADSSGNARTATLSAGAGWSAGSVGSPRSTSAARVAVG